MYSFFGRVNAYVYSSMCIMALSGFINWLTVYFRKELGLDQYGPGELIAQGDKISFEIAKFDQFVLDTYN